MFNAIFKSVKNPGAGRFKRLRLAHRMQSIAVCATS
ncbi:hypothetical protein FHW64_005425 [Variovorax sp. Sphag1AA]|nr:hypothetical protein [Variovorax sp. Sphag1AA]